MGPAVVPNGRDYGAANMLKVEKKKLGRWGKRRWEGEKMRGWEKSRAGGWGDSGRRKWECGMQNAEKKDEEHRRVGGTWRRDELEIKTGEIKAASILVW